MAGLLQRNLVKGDEPLVRAQRNRLVGSFSPLPNEPFPKLMSVVQPLFQQAGFAPEILVRPDAQALHFNEVGISYTGPCSALALAVPLYKPGAARETIEQGIDGFITLCSRVAEALDELARPRGWFGIRRVSGEVPQPVLPGFDKTREQAANLAMRYASFIKNLPRYQRSVEIFIDGGDASPDELADFLDFMGFPPKPAARNMWYDEDTCAALVLGQGGARFVLPCVPRTPNPEAVFQNLEDAARRFSMEFGGTVQEQDTAERVIAGWVAVLQHIHFKPGDCEVREFFPFKPGDKIT